MANYFGLTSYEASLANQFFATNSGATMLISRYGFGGARPHLFGSNVSNLTLNQLQSISGPLSIAFDGYTYSGWINLSGQSFSGAPRLTSFLHRLLNADARLPPDRYSLTGPPERPGVPGNEQTIREGRSL